VCVCVCVCVCGCGYIMGVCVQVSLFSSIGQNTAMRLKRK
jgi:hypothetical protein